MFWRKKKTVKPEPQKRTKKISFKIVEADVGVTRVKVDFRDGRSFIYNVYGEVNQYLSYGNDQRKGDYYCDPMIEPTVGELSITYSLDVARFQIRNYNGQDYVTFVDDIKSVKETSIGVPIKLEILDTKPCLEQGNEYFVEDIK